MRLTLQVIAGPHQGRSFRFAEHDTFVVGRSPDAHFTMPEKDPYFSRWHFVVEINPPLCRLIDMGSHNGTFVNDRRVETADLRDGDLIKAGHTVLRVCLETDAPDPGTCPDLSLMRRLLQGELQGEDAAALERHLLSCPQCGRLAEENAGQNDLLRALQAQVQPPAMPQGAGVKALMDQLAQLPLPREDKEDKETGRKGEREKDNSVSLSPCLPVSLSFDLPPPNPQLSGVDLAAAARDDQRERWQTGQRVPAEDYLRQWPALEQNADAVLDLIYGEFLLREEFGEAPTAAEYLERFPRHAVDLKRLFEVHAGLGKVSRLGPEESLAQPRTEPEVGWADEESLQTPLPGLPAGSRPKFPAVPGYRIVRRLGHGGMGVVYEAFTEPGGCQVALKTILPAVKPTQAILDRFLREAGILRQLRHPNIVLFRDVGESPPGPGASTGLLYFAMDFIAGGDASQLQRKQSPLAVSRVVGWVCQLLDALAYAHAQGFVHRDIKPGNLLISEVQGQEEVHLADFGLARAYQVSPLSGLTLAGIAGGTPAFMPPEQVLDFRSVKPQADQYAVAATLYNLLTGQQVYDPCKSIQELFNRILKTDPVPIQQRRRDLPAALAAAIHRALARKPEDRFASVGSFKQALLPFFKMTNDQ